ncbi:hypothetical protein BJ878DRAFT_312685 [Calycina marina]|uniref:Uncharacterized protein n=1 Tax=Calycina marina TaxID=1763456 RepID=A0A9P7Z685_9HELO|nr:hypothetical protein BJ878DRAFT_312685 [Calycina marina]
MCSGQLHLIFGICLSFGSASLLKAVSSDTGDLEICYVLYGLMAALGSCFWRRTPKQSKYAKVRFANGSEHTLIWVLRPTEDVRVVPKATWRKESIAYAGSQLGNLLK